MARQSGVGAWLFGTVRTSPITSFDGGADVRYVAEYLGHENLESTKIYTRVSVEKLRAVHQATHPAGR
jgi:integrase/recombinase XerD